MGIQLTVKLTASEHASIIDTRSEMLVERVMAPPVIRVQNAEGAQASILHRKEEAKANRKALAKARAEWVHGGMQGDAPTGEGRGRKKTVAGALREKTLSFSLSIQEYTEIQQRAEVLHLQVSDYVRMVLLGIDFCSDLPTLWCDVRERQINAALTYAARRQSPVAA